jgi:hypothetical protein
MAKDDQDKLVDGHIQGVDGEMLLTMVMEIFPTILVPWQKMTRSIFENNFIA